MNGLGSSQLKKSNTMRDLLAGLLTHFFIRCTFAGGSGTLSRTISIGSSLLIRSLGGDALNTDGTLKDASEITWYNDKDNVTPISSGSNPHISHGRMRNSARMAKIIEAEAQTSDTDKKKRRHKVKGKVKAKGTSVAAVRLAANRLAEPAAFAGSGL